jgi:exodeoxyribonuclease VII small subunit
VTYTNSNPNLVFKRLKEILALLESKSVNLTESMSLLEESLNLKKDIEKKLKTMENKLTDLTKNQD